jgi:hypothetical protein
MIHISFSQGCYDGLGCGDEDDEDSRRCKRSDAAALLVSLASCRAAMHPYDPGSSAQDTAGCTVPELSRTLTQAQAQPMVINARAQVTTVRTLRHAPHAYA